MTEPMTKKKKELPSLTSFRLPSRGAELLRLHRKFRGQTQAGYGQDIWPRPAGREPAGYVMKKWQTRQISNWESGRRKPDEGMKARLREFSLGLIRAESWDEPREGFAQDAQTDLEEMIGEMSG